MIVHENPQLQAILIGYTARGLAIQSLNIKWGTETIACTALLLAPGRVAHDPLSTALLGTGITVQVIGDARKPRSYGNAIHEAAYLARNI